MLHHFSRIHVATLAVLIVAAGCRGTRPSSLAGESAAIVLVKEARIPDSEPWYTRFARHSWIDVNAGDGAGWTRIEIISPHSGIGVDPISAEVATDDLRWSDRRVRVRGILRGAEAERVIPDLLARAHDYPDDHYRAVPGPNSNTFIADLVAGTPGLRTTMHADAVGKDYLAPLGVGVTPSKTGGRFDTPVLGIALALQEGVELHLIGLQLGVGIWPPRISIPFLPEIGPAVPASGR